jgi:hypothetical protein
MGEQGRLTGRGRRLDGHRSWTTVTAARQKSAGGDDNIIERTKQTALEGIDYAE